MRYRTQKNFEYGNPLFAQTVRRSWILRHPRWALVVLCIVTVGAVYCLYGLQYWQLKHLTVTGTYTLAIEELQQLTLRQKSGRWLFFFRQDKLWSFDTAAYERRLRERWIFSELKIQRQLPDTIALSITEEKPAYTFTTGSRVFGVDRKGFASTILTGKLPENIPAITFLSTPVDVNLGAALLQPRDAAFFELWLSSLRGRNIPTLAATEIQLGAPPDQTARIQVAGDWSIVVDRTQDAQKQIEAFFTAYDQKLQGRSLEYVDVTVPARVYYK